MWVVDTCVLIDVLDDDPEFGKPSARCLTKHLGEELTVAPVTYVELAPAFECDQALLRRFQTGVGATLASWELNDTRAAFEAWGRYIAAKRSRSCPKRPVADILIGAFASNRTGLITRNPRDFARWFKGLAIINPEDER